MTLEAVILIVIPLALDAMIVPSDTLPPLAITTDIPLEWRLTPVNVNASNHTI